MSHSKKYIEKRCQTEEFAENCAEELANFRFDNDFIERAEKDDWQKAREILAKAPDAKDYDKI